MPPSAIFYNDSLQPRAENGFISWSRLRDPDMPLKFVGDPSSEDTDDEVCLISPPFSCILTLLSASHGSTLDKLTKLFQW